MRFIGLIIVIGIIYLVATRFSPMDSTAEAVKEADAVTQTAGTEMTVLPASASSSLHAPLDRTRAMLEKVRQRNNNGDF